MVYMETLYTHSTIVITILYAVVHRPVISLYCNNIHTCPFHTAQCRIDSCSLFSVHRWIAGTAVLERW